METKLVTVEKEIQLHKDYPQTASKNNPHTQILTIFPIIHYTEIKQLKN